MGQNLISACHRCKEQVYHMRGQEGDLILPFYQKHSDCAKLYIGNVVTIMDNNGTDQNWEPGQDYEYCILGT